MRIESGSVTAIDVDIAIISNEPTPYRLHVLRRLAAELVGVRVHNVFTHHLHDASMPWQMRVGPELRPVFFEDLALAGHERDIARGWRLFGCIRDYLVEHRVKLVIVLGYNDAARLALLRWAKRNGVPTLLHADSNVYSDQRIGLVKRWVKRRFVGWAVEQCAGLMPMGRCGRAYFELYAPGHPGHDKPTFPQPYEPDYAALRDCPPQAKQAFMQRHGLDPNRRRLLYCGRLVPSKGVDVLIDAFAAVAKDCPEWDLVIAGDGPERAALEKRVPELLRGRVKMVGFLQFDEARACYHCSDVLVHPSRYEPWGLVINEAVCCGLAVVATDVTGAAAELVGHRVNGLLTPAGDAAALERAMRDICGMDDAELGRMKAASGELLKAWRTKADPVEAVRAALRHWHITWEQGPDARAAEAAGVEHGHQR